MVVRVAMQAQMSQAVRVVVAAQDTAIVDAVKHAGFEAVLTSAQHLSGTDRLAEACALLKLAPQTVIVNAQGDEPFIDPALINSVANLIANDETLDMATACHAINDPIDSDNRNVVKVVLNHRNEALYFSRATIPFVRDWADDGSSPRPMRHIGIYAYRAGYLQQFSQLSPAPIERLESLEQLRALWFGHRIKLHICATEPAPGVDTPSDLERARAIYLALQRGATDRKSTRLNSSHRNTSRMPSSA